MRGTTRLHRRGWRKSLPTRAADSGVGQWSNHKGSFKFQYGLILTRGLIGSYSRDKTCGSVSVLVSASPRIDGSAALQLTHSRYCSKTWRAVMVVDSGEHIIMLTSLMMLISFTFSRFVVAR